MPIAPLVAAVRRRLANLPGPLSASGEASNDEPVQVELWVAGEWVDLTAGGYVMVRDNSGQIRIAYGIQGSEGSQTERAQASLQLKNSDGRFSLRNPSSPYFGLIGRNTPLRISVPDGNGGKSYRIWGEVSNWAVDWETSGSDVWTDVAVTGIMQRLAQAPAPDHSIIYTAITDPVSPNVVAYWPCEDATGAASLASPLVSASPMTWTGTLALASYAGLAASDPLPDLTTAVLSGGVAKYDDPTAHQVRFLVYIPVDGLSNGKVICSYDQQDYSPGSPQFWELCYLTDTKSLVLTALDSDGSPLGADLNHDLNVRGRLLYVSIEQQEAGTGVTRTLRLRDVRTGVTYSVTDSPTLTSLTRVTRVQFGPATRSVAGFGGTQYLPGVAVGHVTVESAITPIDGLGVRLNPVGETAGRRIQRLCGEEGLPFDWVGDLDVTVPLGAQARQNLLAVAQEATLADGGLLYETRSPLGLGYRTRASLYNQDPALVLSYPGANLAQVPVPVDDDRATQNILTVTVGGVSATYEETEGPLGTAAVGKYGETSGLTLNLSTSDTATLRDHAAWRVHLGTVDEDRFPKISVNLAHPSISPEMRRAILALRMGDRVQITGPPDWLRPDTIDQLAVGVEETITHFEHRLTFTCAPASPYSSVGYLDTASAVIDTDGSELVDAVATPATSLYVEPSAGEDGLWTTDSANLPLNVRVGGETMTVTSITPAIADTFTRSTSNGWGTADTGQAWTNTGGAASEYSTNGSQGLHSLTSVNISRFTVATSPSADVDVRVKVATSALATGDSQFAQVVARYLDANNLYAARVDFRTDQTLRLVLQKRVGGTQSDLSTTTIPGTHAAATFVTIRFQLQGATLRAKAWPTTEVEPDGWQSTVTDSALVLAGSAGVRSVLGSGNTNPLPVTVTFDDFQLTSPQTFTVTRSVNGVTKAQTAGTDLRLAVPTILSL